MIFFPIFLYDCLKLYLSLSFHSFESNIIQIKLITIFFILKKIFFGTQNLRFCKVQFIRSHLFDITITYMIFFFILF